jgi:hypothetical protein
MGSRWRSRRVGWILVVVQPDLALLAAVASPQHASIRDGEGDI